MNAFSISRTHALGVVAVLMLAAIFTPGQAAAPPEIVNFEADPVNALVPGTELSFRLEGTPRATATVSVSGIEQPIPLRETDVGVYEGRYTIRQRDRLPSD